MHREQMSEGEAEIAELTAASQGVPATPEGTVALPTPGSQTPGHQTVREQISVVLSLPVCGTWLEQLKNLTECNGEA